jgi:hypothetical protein
MNWSSSRLPRSGGRPTVLATLERRLASGRSSSSFRLRTSELDDLASAEHVHLEWVGAVSGITVDNRCASKTSHLPIGQFFSDRSPAHRGPGLR